MNPTFLDAMSWEMAEVYGAITDQILANLASYFPYVKATGEITGSFQYQAAMLAKMGQVNRDTAEIILKGLKGADDALRQVLYATIYEALKEEEPKLRAAAQQGLLMGPGFLPPEVDPGTMQAFQSYYRQSADKLNLVNTVMLESTENAYRNTITDAVTRLQKIERTQSILNIGAGETAVGVSSWNEAMHRSVQKMVQNGLTGFVDHGGHKWQPETYVAMDIRTTVFNTARAAVWERSEQYGEDLYQVSSHNGARPLCYPWQAKVISRTDTVRTVYDFEGNEVKVYAQSETSYGQPAGLFGISCRHYPMTFIPGISSIRGQPQSPEENEKAYEESQEQRALERKLRREKLDLEVMKAQGADEAAILAQRDKVRAASADIDEFCNATGRARRRNREYAPIMADFPDPDTYNPAQFERQTQQKMRKYFKDQSQPLQGMDPAAPYKNLKARTEPENQPQPPDVLNTVNAYKSEIEKQQNSIKEYEAQYQDLFGKSIMAFGTPEQSEIDKALSEMSQKLENAYAVINSKRADLEKYLSTPGEAEVRQIFGEIKGEHSISADANAVNRITSDLRSQNNCGFTSLAYDARRRGIDCKAPLIFGSNDSQLTNFWNGFSFQNATYSPDSAKSMIVSAAEEWGVGARGVVEIDTSSISGHYFCFEVNEDGKCVFVDAQTGTTKAEINFENALPGTVKFGRTDDKELTKQAILFLEKGGYQ